MSCPSLQGGLHNQLIVSDFDSEPHVHTPRCRHRNPTAGDLSLEPLLKRGDCPRQTHVVAG